jgi:nucleoside-diphosphate-sugar epimerase
MGMAKYLITGIAGFIGSTIASRLVARGDDVRGVDNLSTGNRENRTKLISAKQTF